MMFPERTEVIVVGAGPTGLALASTLASAGINPLVLEQAGEGANTSRAAVIHARTLEVLEEAEVTPRLLAEGCVVPTFTVRDRARTLARIDFAGLPTAYPYTLMLPQSRTEAILTGRLGELGSAVQRGWRVTAVTASPAGATVHASDANGHQRQVTARYVIGADGMHSAVREAAGIGYTGGRYAQSFVLADVGLDWPLPADEVQLFFSPDGLVVVAPLPGGRHRVVATMDDAPERPGRADVQALLDHRGPGTGRVDDLVWGSRFRVQHRVADAYRRGPVLLAGDAAHVHSPAGGQGMNTGIQDAVDLGHTLRDILQGRSDDSELDGYERRRRPIAERVVALTDRATRLATLHRGGARSVRNAGIALAGRAPTIRHRLARQLAELPEGR